MMGDITQEGQIKDPVLPTQERDTGPGLDNSPEVNFHKAEVDLEAHLFGLRANHMKIKENIITDMSKINGTIRNI